MDMMALLRMVGWLAEQRRLTLRQRTAAGVLKAEAVYYG
jgi:DNA invertase Pin-like site-specific DNA recombinase